MELKNLKLYCTIYRTTINENNITASHFNWTT